MRKHWSQDRYVEAYWFAAEAHSRQPLPGTNLPYIVHPSLVSMEIIAALDVEPGRDEDLAVLCALLHDVIEDGGKTFEEIKVKFGEPVAKGVLALSKDESLPKGLQLDDSLERIRQQPHEIWMVKMADRIANLRPPPHFWTAEKIAGYREEAVRIHRALREASQLLAGRLLRKIDDYGKFLK